MISELSRAEIDELLREQVVGRIGCHAGGLTYVVPVIYAYEGDGLYVASTEGQKVRMLRENSHVCFEVDEYDGAGGWRSAVVQGIYEELEGAEAQEALALLAERFGRADEEGRARRRHGADGRSTVCFRIRIRDVTGRAARR
ncbi:MAG: pyridoxamine 5'-phosphate oxidase family protein [Gaiellaceae bacterium]|jgi:nitroimidazol reductase NimA-like FMN-containing flavoprotein (pyridoxamine 5'-phosphate oxidase superfamily)